MDGTLDATNGACFLMKPDILLESDSFCRGEAIILSNVSVYSACSRDESDFFGTSAGDGEPSC